MSARCWWFTPVILATQEAKIRRIVVQSQPRQIVRALSQKKTLHKKGLVEVQGVGPEFKLQYCPLQKKKENPVYLQSLCLQLFFSHEYSQIELVSANQ
jgi:hypothetical protein